MRTRCSTAPMRLRRRRSCRRAPSGTRTIRCGRWSGAHGGAPVARRVAGRRTAAGSRVAPAGAPACTRSSTTSTPGPCGPVTCSPRLSSPARRGRRKAAAPASSSSARRSSNIATRTASSSSPLAVSVCAPRSRWGADVGWNVGDTHETVVVDDLKRTQIVQYAGASGDYNPLHTDEIFATKVAGYPTVFAHGMLTMGMTGRVVTDLVGAEGLLKFGGRFTSQVFPGDTLTVRATVESVENDVVSFKLSTVNQDGTEVFSGSATANVGFADGATAKA